MASSGSDSPSSPASFPSSQTSSDGFSFSSSSSSSPLPSSTITVASAAEVRRKLEDARFSMQLKFVLAPDASLADAHELWKMVTAGGGGESEFLNPDRLSAKEEAYRFVKNKVERLGHRKRKVDRKQSKVAAEVTKLKEVMDAGGPGVPAGFEPRCYEVTSAHIDISQVIDEEELNEHIDYIRTFLLQGSPATTADGDSDAEADCLDREVKEQLDVTQFNLEYLELKDTGHQLLSAHLQNGIAALEERFLKQRTHLGAGTAEFVRFVDVPIYPTEAPPEGSRLFYA